MKQPKWIESIEATDHWEPGYWVKRGWDRTARMKATAVIDTIAVNMMIAQADATTRIPVGGIAHAGARGISKVEVQVDGGPWTPAQLRKPLSDTTWVIWRYDWPFRPGNHTFTVRCVDGRGTPQAVEMSAPHPAGASGYASKSMTPPFVGSLAVQIAREAVDEIVGVTEAAIADAMKLLMTRAKLYVEGGGAAATAALLDGTLRLPAGARVVALVSGGNVDLSRVPRD